jgi:hypothetical protein
MKFTGWQVGMSEIAEIIGVAVETQNPLTGKWKPVGGVHLFARLPFTWPIRTDLDRPFDWELDVVSGEFD